MNGEVATRLARVPCTIVTGFLGAGKTTLIRHVLANAQGRRLAVIVNEFGDVGIDGEILKGCGDAACPEDNIVDLAALADGRVAADLDALKRQRAADSALMHDDPVEEVFEDQIACADLVVLNKRDLLDEDGLNRARAAIADALPGSVKVLTASDGKVDHALLLGLGIGTENDIANRRTRHNAEAEHDHDDFDNFVVALDEIADPSALVARVGSLAERFDVLRVKGFAAVANK